MTDEKKPGGDTPREGQQPTPENSEQKPAGSPNPDGKAKPAPKPKPKPKKDPRAKLAKPERTLIISSSPHFHTVDSVPRIMWNVIAALAPASILAVVSFGLAAVSMILVCVMAALITEILANRMKGEAMTIADGSAAITGLLLALTLPPSLPLWAGALGSIFAISIGKHLFGGLGYNIFNPALLGRAFLQASFPVAMTTWTWPNTMKGVDGITAATPLGQFKFEAISSEYVDMLIGNTGGSLGETSALAVMAGGIYLLVRKYADWRIPVSFMSTVFVLAGVFWLIAPDTYPDPVFHLLGGGLMLGAFFMATDMVSSPVTARGSLIFGIGAGFLLVIIRLFGGLPEGVMYAILLMNAFTPLINRYTRPEIFGEVRA